MPMFPIAMPGGACVGLGWCVHTTRTLEDLVFAVRNEWASAPPLGWLVWSRDWPGVWSVPPPVVTPDAVRDPHDRETRGAC
jgi:hypothetical protein